MVLVTGGTGLVGSHLLLHLLENKEKVRALYRNDKNLIRVQQLFEVYNRRELYLEIEWIQGDITDIPSLEVAFEYIDYIYHCAAQISFDPKDEKSLRKINIEGTANIINLALDYKIKKLCHVSSIAALGDLLDYESIITEETEWLADKYHDDYAITKYGAEIEVWRGQEEGLNVVIVNPGVILGPGFWENGSGKIFSTISKGFNLYTKGSTGFIAVTDVVKIMVQLMKSDIKGERFTLVAENIVFKDVIVIIATALRVKVPTLYAKPWITTIGWKMDWLLSKLFSRKRKLSKATATSSHINNLFSNEKIKKTLNYNFVNVKDYSNEVARYFFSGKKEK